MAHASERKFKVVWWVLWIVVVWTGMEIMEGRHLSSVWRVVWVAVVEAGMAVMEDSHGLSTKAPNVTSLQLRNWFRGPGSRASMRKKKKSKGRASIFLIHSCLITLLLYLYC